MGYLSCRIGEVSATSVRSGWTPTIPEGHLDDVEILIAVLFGSAFFLSGTFVGRTFSRLSHKREEKKRLEKERRDREEMLELVKVQMSGLLGDVMTRFESIEERMEFSEKLLLGREADQAEGGHQNT